MIVVARLALVEIQKGRSAHGKSGHGTPTYVVANRPERLEGVLHRSMPRPLPLVLLEKVFNELRVLTAPFHDNLGVGHFESGVFEHVVLYDVEDVVVRVHAVV